MEYIVYVSTAKKLLSEEELLALLTVSRTKNKLNKITGMLLYSGGTFMQVIEGEMTDIERLFKTIELDNRHKNIIKLINGTTEKRNFADWSMAFASVNNQVLQDFEGFLNPSNENFLGKNDHTSIAMLKTFAEQNQLTSN